MSLHLAGEPKADRLISKDPLALLIGMVLDQQIPLEWAFAAPVLLVERMAVPLDARTIAAMDPEELTELFQQRPALHRFPGSMARRVHQLAQVVVDQYGGSPAKIWKTAKSGDELLARIEALPGFGKQKAKIFVALLGKQLNVQPAGWREASSPFGSEGSHLSIADIDSPETLGLVREHKQQMKAAAKTTVPGTSK
ncbi:MAG: HhH-GPD-type base excision DNA repair protein [Acidimicrobiales bacterium]